RRYVGPEGIAVRAVHPGPDRLGRPVRRNAAGDFEEISWDEAFDLVARRLGEIRARHGSDAIGFYWGNPTGNNHGALLMLSSFTKAIGTRNRFSAGSQDANPRIVTSYELYGSSIPIQISWDEAFDLVARRLGEIRARHGSDAIGFYWGNPTGNNHGALLMLSSFTKAIGTRNRFSAGSQDANPRIVTSYELYGSSISIPIPALART